MVKTISLGSMVHSSNGMPTGAGSELVDGQGKICHLPIFTNVFWEETWFRNASDSVVA
jgi:hypothetical protein